MNDEEDLMGVLFTIAGVLAFVSWAFLSGCGAKIKVEGDTEHKVGGEARIVNEIVLKVDVSGCQTLEGESQASCIRESVEALGDLVELIKSLSCKDQECLGG